MIESSAAGPARNMGDPLTQPVPEEGFRARTWDARRGAYDERSAQRSW